MIKWLEVTQLVLLQRQTSDPDTRSQSLCAHLQLQQEMEISMVLSISFVRDLGRFQAQAGLLGNPGDKVPARVGKETILPTVGSLECCG